jgi:hypothetical protein
MDEDISLDRRWGTAVNTLRSGDKAGALYIFKSLSKGGEPAACREIGNIYEFGGGGVEQDIREAISWYKEALNKDNDGYACIGLARIYYYGKLGEPDYLRALSYLQVVEDNDLPLANLMMGRLYRFGKGVDASHTRAREYYEKAANKGNLFASKELGLLEIESRNYMKGVIMLIKGFFKSVFIGMKNIHDPRIKNC